MKKITDYAELIKAKHALNKTIAPVEDGASMTGSYTSGQQFIRDGVLYTALTSIAASTAFSSLTLDTDYEVADDITSQLSSVNSAIANKENVPTVLTQTLAASATTLTFTDASIGNNSRIRYYSNPFVVGLITGASQSGTTVTLTCAAQTSSVSVTIEVVN